MLLHLAAMGFAGTLGWLIGRDPASWGSLSGWVGAGATLIAVLVALNNAQRSADAAADAISSADIRAAKEREFNHRRENTKAVVEMWTAINAVHPKLSAYRAILTVAEARLIEREVVESIAAAKSAILYALTVSLDEQVQAELRGVSRRFDEMTQEWLKAGPPIEQVIAAHDRVTSMQGKTIDIIKNRLPLIDSAEAELARRLAEQPKENTDMLLRLFNRLAASGGVSGPGTITSIDLTMNGRTTRLDPTERRPVADTDGDV